MRDKKSKRPNATRHGVYRTIHILSGENPEEFKNLLDGLIEEWQPDGVFEQDTVLTIAACLWRKDRLRKFIEIEVIKKRFDPDHPAFDEALGFGFLIAGLRRNPEEFERDIACYLRSDRVVHLQQKFPRARFESAAKWADAVIEELKLVLLPAYSLDRRSSEAVTATSDGSFFRSATAFPLDLFERELAIEGRLEATIDRLFKRLIQSKAMKQMLQQTGAIKPNGRIQNLGAPGN